MERLSNKIALVTGASSGIGLACALALAKEGCRVIITGRRAERLEKLARTIRDQGGTCLPLPFDIRNKKEIDQAIQSLDANWRDIDILINNAGLSKGLDKLHEGRTEDWEAMIQTNVMGLLYITRAVVPGMVTRGRGDIVNIGSIAGHEVYPKGNVYCASKHAVTALTKGLRMDLVDTPLRVSTVDPGLVETEFSIVRFDGDQERAKNVYRGLEPLHGEDIAEAVVFIVTRPRHVQIGEIIIFPTAQASSTVVSRK